VQNSISDYWQQTPKTEYFIQKVKNYLDQKCNGGYAGLVADMLNNTLCLDMHPIDIMERIKINCGLSSYNDMQWANHFQQGLSECVKSVVMEDRKNHIFNEYNIALTPQQLALFSKSHCFLNCNFKNCEKDITMPIINFLNAEQNSEEAWEYAEFIIDMINEDNEYKGQRFIELYDLMEEDPDFLVRDCFNGPGPDVEFWSELASFVPDQSVRDKIISLGPGWKLQPLITPTNAPSINLDHFGVEISQFPFINGINGPRFSPVELLEHIRKNLNDFHSQFLTSFEPIPDDQELWNSSNAKGAVISIDIFPDDGSVICSQHEGCCWIFSTLTAPLWPYGQDATHPVSGNRQFGIKPLSNGNYEFFIKGVDRYFVPFDFTNPARNSSIKLVAYIMEKIAFMGADNLWNSVQDEVISYITQKGGNASKGSTFKKRPKFQDAINMILKQNYPITHVPCD
jgi:hypothetical protein